MKSWLIVLAVVLLGALGPTTGAAVASDAATLAAGAVTLSATVNGQDVASADQQHPVRLDPATPADVAVTVTNGGSVPLTVAAVDFSGHVLGLSFFAFHTSVAATVGPGATKTLSYPLDLSGLDGQATGLVNGTLAVQGADGEPVAQLPTVVDVQGSLVSVYGLFGLALVILTVLALVDTALAIARNRMPQNRWRRGLRLLTPGIGIGLVLVFTLSAFRVWVPSTERWLFVAGAFAVGFFLLGYLTPTPPDADAELDEALADQERAEQELADQELADQELAERKPAGRDER